tara:strand:+ start:148 stop:579 length:432 start_codon:yes stop_codon:yes gene_type:complete
MNIKPLVLRRENGIIRQVFGDSGTYFLLPDLDSLSIISGQIPFPVVDVKEKTGLFSFKQTYDNSNVPSIEEAIGDEMDKLELECPNIDKYNGIYILDTNRIGVHKNIRGNRISRQIETGEYQLVRYELTDRVIFKALARENPH